MKDDSKQMTVNNLKVVSKLFLEKNNVSENEFLVLKSLVD